MPAPGVTIKEIDLSTRIPNFEGIYGVMVIDSERGPTDKPVLVSNESQLLREYTLDEAVNISFSTGYFEALAFLESSNKLWVKRVAGTGALSGGVTVSNGSTTTVNAVLATGEADPSTHTPVTDEAMLIHASSVGIWSGDAGASGVGFKLHNERSVEDIDSTTDLVGALITLNTPAQEWVTGEPVTVRPKDAGVLPTSLVQGTTYYVKYVDGDDINLTATIGGAAIADVVTGASGSFYIDAVNKVEEPDSFKLEVFRYADQVNPIETFYLSRDTAKKDGYGKNIYVETRMEASRYLRINDNTLVANTVLPKSQPQIIFLDGGVDGASATTGQCQTAIAEFSAKETYPITVIMDGGIDFIGYKNALLTLAGNRGDCVAYLGNPQSVETSATTYVTDIIDWKATLNTSSYGALFTPSCKVYDKYNDRELYIGASGFAGSALANTAYNYEAWYAPAGDTKGFLNSTDVNIRFTQADMDLLYDNYINPIKYSPTKGVAIYGQKTLINRPTALDRLSTRLAITIIQPRIAELLESFLFEFNDDSTRGIVTNKIEAYLEGVKARRGVYDFRVVVDDTNNTDEDIDNHILNVEVYIKPNQVTEFINFTTIITNRGISFDSASTAL